MLSQVAVPQGYSPNTDDLASVELAVDKAAAVGQVDVPRIISAGGMRRTRPKRAISHILKRNPTSVRNCANAVGVGFHELFLGR